jgi:transposase
MEETKMTIRKAVEIQLSEKQRTILEAMKKGTHSPLHLIQRSTIILLASDGLSNKEIERQMNIERNTVKKWRNRIAKATPELKRIENEQPWKLKAAVEAALQDEERPGKPPKFTAEQVAHIIKIACEKPEDHGVPLSHWTPSALAREAVKQNIVENISSRQVGRFLKRFGFKASSEPILAESEHRR